MRDRDRRQRPQVESLEGLTLLSGVAAHIPVVAHAPALRMAAVTSLSGTAHGTFFAHTGSASSGTIYSLFASGRLGGVGPTLLVGGFQSRGFSTHGAGGGNLVIAAESQPGNLFLRLTELAGPTPATPGEYLFAYSINHGSGAFQDDSGSGTLALDLVPINTNLQAQPVSNPGFFGNSTLNFQGGGVASAARAVRT
jgi:hypothetical protein